MSWVCPSCKRQRENTDVGCPCGFAPHKILGISANASEDEMRSAYKYLQGVWDPAHFSHDLSARRRAEARMAQINTAYRIYAARFARNEHETSRRVPLAGIAIAGAIAFVIVVSAMFALRGSQPELTATSQAPSVSVPQAATAPSGTTLPQSAPSTPPAAPSAPQPVIYADMNEQQAIELAKNSKILDRIFSADAIIRKWTEENSSRFKVIGWNARRADETSFLVSYTVMDGALTRGFYFDVNATTGEVQNVAANAELQKKHKILFNSQP